MRKPSSDPDRSLVSWLDQLKAVPAEGLGGPLQAEPVEASASVSNVRESQEGESSIDGTRPDGDAIAGEAVSAAPTAAVESPYQRSDSDDKTPQVEVVKPAVFATPPSVVADPPTRVSSASSEPAQDLAPRPGGKASLDSRITTPSRPVGPSKKRTGAPGNRFFAVTIVAALSVLAVLYRQVVLGPTAQSASQGVKSNPSATAIPAHVTFEAESYTAEHGIQKSSYVSAGGVRVTVVRASTGDWLGYTNRLLARVHTVGLRYAEGKGNVKVQIRAGAVSGPLVGTIILQKTRNSSTFKQASAKLTASSSRPLFIIVTEASGLEIDTIMVSS